MSAESVLTAPELVDRLERALMRAHRPHTPDCATDRFGGSYDQPPDPCTCGLDDLMERTASRVTKSVGLDLDRLADVLHQTVCGPFGTIDPKKCVYGRQRDERLAEAIARGYGEPAR